MTPRPSSAFIVHVVVAGDINVVGNEAEWWQTYEFRRNVNANVRRAGVEPSGREQLADYYVYPLAQATTIAFMTLAFAAGCAP